MNLLLKGKRFVKDDLFCSYVYRNKGKKGKGCWGYVWARCFVIFIGGRWGPWKTFSSLLFISRCFIFWWIHSSFQQLLHDWLQQRPAARSRPSPCWTGGGFYNSSPSSFAVKSFLCLSHLSQTTTCKCLAVSPCVSIRFNLQRAVQLLRGPMSEFMKL